MPSSLKRHPVLWSLLTLSLLGSAWLTHRHLSGIRVEVARATQGPLVQTVVTMGRVRPQRLRLAAMVQGQVRAVHVTEGQQVAAGSLLLELDPREALAQVAQAAANLQRARAERHTMGSLQREQAAELLAQAEARAQEARRDLQRLEPLAASGTVADKTLQRARTTLEVNESALREARAQRLAVDRDGARMLTAQAAVRQAEASLALAQARLEYCRIAAPLEGVVIGRSVQVGDVIGPAAPVIELAATARTELVAELDERHLPSLALGQTALASAEAFPDKRFEAQTHFISPAVDAQRGTVEVRLLVPDAPAYLRPDMTVSIDIEIARRESALTLPLRAVRDLAGAPYVLVLHQGRAKRQLVVLGIQGEQRVELSSGIDRTSLVILDSGVASGMRVSAREAQP